MCVFCSNFLENHLELFTSTVRWCFCGTCFTTKQPSRKQDKPPMSFIRVHTSRAFPSLQKLRVRKKAADDTRSVCERQVWMTSSAGSISSSHIWLVDQIPRRRSRLLYIVSLFRSWLQFCRSVSKWHGRIMMGCETPLQIPIVLPSLCFRGNSLLPSGRPSSLSSSHFHLMAFSSVLFSSHFCFFRYCFSFFAKTSF